MPKRKTSKKRLKKHKKPFLMILFLIFIIGWFFLPHIFARGVDIGGFRYESADGNFVMGSTLNNAIYRSNNIEVSLPRVDIQGTGPFGDPLQVSAANGNVKFSGKGNNLDAINLKLEIQPLITNLKKIEVSFLEGEVFVVGKGRIYNFERDGESPLTFWDCLLVATTPEGLKVAEGVLQMPLEEHLARWNFPEDTIDGTAGEVVEAISGWFAKQVGKLMKDYIFFELEARPKLELKRVSHISTKEIQKKQLQDSWDFLWSKRSAGC